jgi:hypothetical protein
MKSMKWFKAVVSETFANVELPLGAEVYVAKINRYGTERDDVIMVWPQGQMTMSVTSAQSHLILDKSRALIGGPFGPQETSEKAPRKARKARKGKRSLKGQTVARKPNRKREISTGFAPGTDEHHAIAGLIEAGENPAEIVDCPRCGGSGQYGRKGVCYCCKGHGSVTRAAAALHFVGIAKQAMYA